MENLIQDVRYALRKLAASPGFAVSDGHHAGARHRREYGDVQRPQRRHPASAGLPGTRQADVHHQPVPEPRASTSSGCRHRNSWSSATGTGRSRRSGPTRCGRRIWRRSAGPTGHGARHQRADADPRASSRGSGRAFTLADTLPGAEDVAILSDSLWRSSFGADPAILGKTPKIDGLPTRIVGVMPPGYDVHGQKVELWLPLTLDPNAPGQSGRPLPVSDRAAAPGDVAGRRPRGSRPAAGRLARAGQGAARAEPGRAPAADRQPPGRHGREPSSARYGCSRARWRSCC